MAEGKYRVLITTAAENDLLRADRWLLENHPIEARHWIRDTREAILALDEMPRRCPRAVGYESDVREIRTLLVGRYLALFEIESDVVRILRVIHTARQQRGRIVH